MLPFFLKMPSIDMSVREIVKLQHSIVMKDRKNVTLWILTHVSHGSDTLIDENGDANTTRSCTPCRIHAASFHEDFQWHTKCSFDFFGEEEQ